MARSETPVREQIIVAFQQLLIDDGERAATLDAVAARAGVSKGGLLYHFRSKDALVSALTERLRELADADAAEMRRAPEGAAVHYVRGSAEDDSPLDRTLVATARLVQGSVKTARDAMLHCQRQWYEAILDEVGDAATAWAILLLGDGLYYNSVLTGSALDPSKTPGAADAAQEAVNAPPHDLERLIEIVEVLKRHATERRRRAE
ncbi:TetR/AcrR family transcriptional regulator [Ruicaihuangia caeni]|uniref:TetR/AcrR family transcriptional regulator n=1 Tax=Ruicaihuangia caeni TaxID=3042517 RepID=UPI00338F1A8A